MKRPLLSLAALLALLPACPSPPGNTMTPPAAPAASPLEGAVRAFVEELSAGRFGAAAARFDEPMRAAMPEAKLADAWRGILADLGPFVSVDATSVEESGKTRAVHATTRFARGRQDLKVVFGEGERISGFWRGLVPADLEADAVSLVKKLAAGDAPGAAVNFDEKMKAALPPEKLGAVWAQLQAGAGPFAAIDDVKVTRTGGHHTALLTCRFGKAPLVAKVVFDLKGLVAGLFFVPPEAVAPWRKPAYAHPDAFTEAAVQVGSAPALPGTLTLPRGAGPFPVVVLVHGSGPNDADESVGGAKVFKDLAWGLGSRQVAVLRYEKRTRHAPAGVVGVKEEVLDGAAAAVALCRRTPELDPQRVVVLGHSQGGELAPKIAAGTPGVAALVMLAAPSRPLQDLVVDQLAYFTTLDPASPERKNRLAEAHAFKKKLDDPALQPEDEVLFPGGGAMKGAYFLSMRGYHPAQVAAGLSLPILLLQGDRDYQVTAPDLDGYKKALSGKKNVVIKQYPRLNHLFIAGQGASRPEEYDVPGHVDEEVVADIAAFIGKLPR